MRSGVDTETKDVPVAAEGVPAVGLVAVSLVGFAAQALDRENIAHTLFGCGGRCRAGLSASTAHPSNRSGQGKRGEESDG